MERHPDSLEPAFVGNEAQCPRIRGLMVLARLIVRDLINNRREGKNNNNTTTNDLRNRLTHDEGLS